MRVLALQAALNQFALQAQRAQQARPAASPLLGIASTLLEAGLMDPAFYAATARVDFVPDGLGPADAVLGEEGARRAEAFNAGVDSYLAARLDPRPRADVEAAAKIGPDGGPLFQRCGGCAALLCDGRRAVRWCPTCKVRWGGG